MSVKLFQVADGVVGANDFALWVPLAPLGFVDAIVQDHLCGIVTVEPCLAGIVTCQARLGGTVAVSPGLTGTVSVNQC